MLKVFASCLISLLSLVAMAVPVNLVVHRGGYSFVLEPQYKQAVQKWNADGTLSVWFTAYNSPRAKVRRDGASATIDKESMTICYAMKRMEPPYEMNSATYPVILEFQLGHVSRKNYAVSVLTQC